MNTLISANEAVLFLISSYPSEKSKQKLSFEQLLQHATDIDIENIKYQEIKPSIFNYCSHSSTGYLIFNTLYNSLVRLSTSEYKQYQSGDFISKKLRKELIKSGIIVSNTINELKVYLKIADLFVKHPKRPLSITITTTLKCNARCPYCYEHGVKQQDMLPENTTKIIDFIKANQPQNGLLITWFGGEPLLNISLIDDISSRLKNEGISFSSYIISNGSLFTVEIISTKIEQWNLRDVQITLDGPQEYYESIKNYSPENNIGFYHILNVIRLLSNHNINVHIRLNISRNNLSLIEQLVKELDYAFSAKDNILFCPAFLTGTSDKLSEAEKLECIRRLFKIVTNPRKLTAGSRFYSMPRTEPCNNSNPRSFTIDVSGDIFSCEHFVGVSSKAIGTLNSFDASSDPRHKRSYIRKKCKECVFFPKCFGGCKANLNTRDEPCFIEKYILQAYMSLL
ncbi:MAG: radical SAM protein [Fibrobacter sp.]|nr:radical SAM protein [Fibrobacter sp.]